MNNYGQINNDSIQAEQEVSSTENNKSKKKYFWIGAIIASVIVLTVIIVSLVAAPSKIDPFDYVTVKFEGYNSQGICRVDKSNLVYHLIGEEPTNYEDAILWENEYNQYYEDISYTIEPNEHLSNGDKITIVFTVSDKAKQFVQSSQKVVTVSGLTEVENVDVFGDISVSFEGVSGEASVKIQKTTDTEYLQSCSFSIEPQYKLSNGDIVTVSITNSQELADTYKCIPKEIVREYTVIGLDSYISLPDQLQTELIDNITQQFIEEEEAKHKSESDIFTYSKVNHYKTYFGIPKEGQLFVKNNILVIYIYYDEYLRGDFHRTVYMPIEFTDVVMNSDGNIDLNYEDGVSATFTTNIDSSVEELTNNYTLSEIG